MRELSALGLCLIFAAGTVLAAETAGEGEPKKEEPAKEVKWYDRLTFGGDFRLRYEGFSWEGKFDGGSRHRFRYRLRVGLTAQINKKIQVGFQLRSGNPNNPISDNQTFDEGFNKNRISIATAYASWQATKNFSLIGGKFRPKGLWVAMDSEWDNDVTVEGLMQNFRWRFVGPVKTLGVNAWQFILNESGSGPESRSYGLQAVPIFGFGQNNTLAAGVTYQYWQNPSEVAELYFDGDVDIDSGTVTNFVDPDTLMLVSDFRLLNVMFDWRNKSMEKWPVRVSVYLYKNLGAEDAVGVILPAPDPDDPADREPVTAGNSQDNDTGYFARVEFGKFNKWKQIAIRLSRYYSKPDAVFFAYTQSDTRRSSNVDAWRLDFRLGLPKKSFFNFTYYRSEWAIGEDTPMNRWQFDYVIGF
jgi:hypothetical protein